MSFNFTNRRGANYKGFYFSQSVKAQTDINTPNRIGESIIVTKDDTGDTNSIKEALKEAEKEKGKKIVIKEGNYEITETLNIPENTQIQGVGRNAQITTTDSITMFKCQGNNILIENLLFGASTSTTGIDTNARENITIRECEFLAFEKAIIQSAIYSKIEENYFEVFFTAIESAGENNVITSNTFNAEMTGDTIIQSNGSQNLSITSNIAKGITEDYIGDDSDDGVQITGNNFTNDTNDNKTEYKGTRAVITGNIINEVELTSTSDNSVVVGNKATVTDNGSSNTVANNN